jgi:thiamine biosynthesis protein ThiS
VSELLDELGLSRELVAVELNRRILRRGEFNETAIEDGDELEVVHFVGGG